MQSVAQRRRAVCVGSTLVSPIVDLKSSLYSGLVRFHTVKGGEGETVKSDSDRTVWSLRTTLKGDILPVIDVISRQCQITAHCIHNCIEVQLSELSCLGAVSASIFFVVVAFFCFFLVESFWSRKQKCVGAPPLDLLPFFLAFVPFLGWPRCPFAWPKCRPKSKVPFFVNGLALPNP